MKYDSMTLSTAGLQRRAGGRKRELLSQLLHRRLDGGVPVRVAEGNVYRFSLSLSSSNNRQKYWWHGWSFTDPRRAHA